MLLRFCHRPVLPKRLSRSGSNRKTRQVSWCSGIGQRRRTECCKEAQSTLGRAAAARRMNNESEEQGTGLHSLQKGSRPRRWAKSSFTQGPRKIRPPGVKDLRPCLSPGNRRPAGNRQRAGRVVEAKGNKKDSRSCPFFLKSRPVSASNDNGRRGGCFQITVMFLRIAATHALNLRD